MIPVFEFGLKYFKNRKRFNGIIIDKRFPYLKTIYQRLLTRDRTLTDEEILTAYFKFSDSQQSNSYAIAELELVIISIPCYFRPNLTDKLLERAIVAIIASLGNKADYIGVTRFIDDYILRKNQEPYGGLPPTEGTNWLKNLKADQELIETTLKKMQLQIEH
jgi:hypothetical protein